MYLLIIELFCVCNVIFSRFGLNFNEQKMKINYIILKLRVMKVLYNKYFFCFLRIYFIRGDYDLYC